MTDVRSTGGEIKSLNSTGLDEMYDWIILGLGIMTIDYTCMHYKLPLLLM